MKIKMSGSFYKMYKLLLIFSLLIPNSQKIVEEKGVKEDEKYEFESIHMGTNFKIVLYAQDSLAASQASSSAFAKIAELDSTLSDYIEHSELNKLSHTSGMDSTVVVSNSLFEVLSTANKISRKTDGLFDITVGPYVSLWRSVKKEEQSSLPNANYLKNLHKSVGYRNMLVDDSNQTVRLLQPDMKLDVGGIGKGYATQKALEVLQNMGIDAAYVDGGGDISVGSPPPGQAGWTIAVPLYTRDGKLNLKAFTLSGVSIATSGDLYQHITIDSTRYSHVIDPRTGLGATKQVQATVIAPDGALADALASTLTISGIESAQSILMQFPDAATYITQVSTDTLKILESENLKKYLHSGEKK